MEFNPFWEEVENDEFPFAHLNKSNHVFEEQISNENKQSTDVPENLFKENAE